MRASLALALWLACTVLSAPALAQSNATRGLAAAGKALADWADRQAQMEQELELVRKKAEIEAEARRNAAAQRPVQGESEAVRAERILNTRMPGWDRIVVSKMFGTWLTAQPRLINATCRTTNSAETMLKCIELFLTAEYPASAGSTPSP